MKRLLAAALFVAVAAPAVAQMTTCTGLECTVEENGKSRKLTHDEALQHMRANMRSQTLTQIQCMYAIDKQKCEALKVELFSLFSIN